MNLIKMAINIAAAMGLGVGWSMVQLLFNRFMNVVAAFPLSNSSTGTREALA